MAFEQRACVWRRAVDFVGEHHGIEDRSRVERVSERSSRRYAEDVRGQEVARELDARVLETQRRRQRLRQRRLADARNVLDEQMPAREQASQREA
jgi:hypothetical protein